MRIDRIDHFVLTVADVTATCAFYQSALGMDVVEFGDGRKALAFGDQKINLHRKGGEFLPNARVATAGSADFCLTTSVPLDEVVAHLAACGTPSRRGRCGVPAPGPSCVRSMSAIPTAIWWRSATRTARDGDRVPLRFTGGQRGDG